jgi:hypothetical protein
MTQRVAGFVAAYAPYPECAPEPAKKLPPEIDFPLCHTLSWRKPATPPAGQAIPGMKQV